MCGIAGFVNLDGEKASDDFLRRMTKAVAHRGPDGQGVWTEDNVGLGHRRLSVIDPTSTGDQPMFGAGDRYVITYNGEIYNFLNLKEELLEKGHAFRGSSDTEVLLYAFAEWGTGALDRLNGMFAFAIFDRQRRSLFIARDRYGVKPVYFSIQGSLFLFGSEQRAIEAHPRFKSEIEPPALLEYFTFQNFLSSQTLSKDVHLLQPGHFLEVDLSRPAKEAVRQRKYWDYWFRDPVGNRVDRREYVEELERLFVQAVHRQLVSDVEVGTYLSGGIDSGSIASVAASRIDGLKSFTVGFDISGVDEVELNYDERIRAEKISGLLGTEHYEMVLKHSDMERALPSVAWHIEEPRVGQSYPNFLAAKLASKFVKVVLSGAGGDEMFGGYPWRYFHAQGAQNFDQYVDSYYAYWQRLLSNSELRRLFSPVWDQVKHVWTRDIFRDVFESHENQLERPEDYVNHSLYFEAKTFLHGLFVVEDKLSMAHGLETRVPFMDNDLVDFAMSCPVDLKVASANLGGRLDENISGRKPEIFEQNHPGGKSILREMMSKIVSPEAAAHRKQGFSSPDASWFRVQSRGFIEGSLCRADAPLAEYLDSRVIRELVSEHFEGTRNRRLLVWSLLSLNSYLGQKGA